MVNRVILLGRLGKDPEVRYTSGGQAVCTLSLATNRSWNDKQSAQRREETEWHSVEVFAKTAENCGQYLSKGSQVYVEGRLKTDKWKDKETGQDRYRVKIVADAVRFLGGKGEGGAAGGQRRGGGAGGSGGGGQDEGSFDQGGGGGGGANDDIPF